MVFINEFLPLPVRAAITESYSFNNTIVHDSKYEEQRIPRLSEYLFGAELSDCRFTETELLAFVTFFRTQLQGKLNTFKFRSSVDFIAEDIVTTPPTTPIFSYGAAVYIGGENFQLVKVYEYNDGTNCYRGIKTITRPIIIPAITFYNWQGTPVTYASTVDESTGIVTLTGFDANIDTELNNQPMKAGFNFNLECRLDVDSVPQIIMAARPEGQTTGCDHYQFQGLQITEVLGNKINPYAATNANFTVNTRALLGTGSQDALNNGLTAQPFPSVMAYTFDELPFRPLEEFEYVFQNSVNNINGFEVRSNYNQTERLRATLDETLLKGDASNNLLNFWNIVKGNLCRFNIALRNLPISSVRFDQDTLTLSELVANNDNRGFNMNGSLASLDGSIRNITTKSLHSLDGLDVIEAVPVTPIDLTGFNTQASDKRLVLRQYTTAPVAANTGSYVVWLMQKSTLLDSDWLEWDSLNIRQSGGDNRVFYSHRFGGFGQVLSGSLGTNFPQTDINNPWQDFLMLGGRSYVAGRPFGVSDHGYVGIGDNAFRIDVNNGIPNQSELEEYAFRSEDPDFFFMTSEDDEVFATDLTPLTITQVANIVSDAANPFIYGMSDGSEYIRHNTVTNSIERVNALGNVTAIIPIGITNAYHLNIVNDGINSSVAHIAANQVAFGNASGHVWVYDLDINTTVILETTPMFTPAIDEQVPDIALLRHWVQTEDFSYPSAGLLLRVYDHATNTSFNIADVVDLNQSVNFTDGFNSLVFYGGNSFGADNQSTHTNLTRTPNATTLPLYEEHRGFQLRSITI